jgi:Na+/pantothenate symporter
VGGRIGFLGQNFVFAELVFPRRQSTCCEFLVASLYLLFNFVQSTSIIYLGATALLRVDLYAH